MAEIKQYTFDELKEFYSEDKYALVNLYKEQFKDRLYSYINQDGLFPYRNSLLMNTSKLIHKEFGIKYGKICIFTHCFDENRELLNGILTTDSDDDLYFIESKECIKIGRTNDISIRLNTLQTHNSDNLKVLLLKCGSGNNEFAIHRLFRYLRVKGEWFIKHKDIYDYIELLKQHNNIQKDPYFGKIRYTRSYLMNDL